MMEREIEGERERDKKYHFWDDQTISLRRERQTRCRDEWRKLHEEKYSVTNGSLF